MEKSNWKNREVTLEREVSLEVGSRVKYLSHARTKHAARTHTLPPAAPAAVLAPAVMQALPPAPLSPPPTVSDTDPPAPPEALPVSIESAPELPPADPPLLTLTSPLLLPAPLALAEPTDTLPLELDELTPLVTLTDPPLQLPP